MPTQVVDHAGADGPFTLMTPEGGEQVAYVESQGNGRVITNRESVRGFAVRYGVLRAQALSPAESVRHIEKLLQGDLGTPSSPRHSGSPGSSPATAVERAASASRSPFPLVPFTSATPRAPVGASSPCPRPPGRLCRPHRSPSLRNTEEHGRQHVGDGRRDRHRRASAVANRSKVHSAAPGPGAAPSGRLQCRPGARISARRAPRT